MNKEFIPYEQALTLKELNFNEQPFAIYDLESGLKIYRDDRILINNAVGFTFAPLYQQTFRWFREKHKLSGIPTDNSYEIWSIFKNKNLIIDRECIIEEYPLKSYKDSELACLKKLIEIVKINKDGKAN